MAYIDDVNTIGTSQRVVNRSTRRIAASFTRYGCGRGQQDNLERRSHAYHRLRNRMVP